MNDIPSLLINVLYGASLLLLCGMIVKTIVIRNMQFAVPSVLIACCFLAGEYFTWSYPQHLGTAFYGIGNFVLLFTLINLFGGITARIGGLLLFVPLAIIFTGYFWPKGARGADYFYVINAAVISVNLANAAVFAINRIAGRWLFVSIYIVLSLWMAGYVFIPHVMEDPAGGVYRWELGAKSLMALLQFLAGFGLMKRASRGR